MESSPQASPTAGQRIEPGQEITLAEALQIAVRHHQAGHLQEAAPIYRQILQADPKNAHVYYLLGAACQALGRVDEAVVQLEHSLRLRPGFPEVHNHLGVVRAQQGRFDLAVASFQEALRLKPNYGEAHANLAKAIQELERMQRIAAVSFSTSPRSAEEWNNQGVSFVSQGRVEEALSSFREAIRLRPDLAEGHSNLGKLLARQGRLDEAIAALRRAIELRPELFDAHFSLGNALREKGLLEEAATCYQEAVRLAPNDFGAQSNLGGVLMELGQLEAALAADREALRLRPAAAESHSNLGVVLVELGRVDEALQCYAEAVRLKPDYAEAHKNRAIAWLTQGDFTRGWPEYQWRWLCPEFTPPNFHQPRWDGSPLQGRTILLYAEQGLGDTLHFIRYVPLVRRGGGRVLVMCPRSLHQLLREGPEIDGLLGPGETPPPFDVYAPLLSLPGLMGTTPATIPAEVPYLRTKADPVERWRRELSKLDGFKIGIAWQGSREHKRDRFRSVPVETFAPLVALSGVRLVSLQKGPGADQLSRLPQDWQILDAGNRIEDWADTAGLVKHLDLVVTVDSAVAHLAGALAIPVWVALPFAPDWRWLQGREDSPWYPSMRLFRQRERGQWTDVFARIATAVQTLLGRPA
ncbi:MAG TPA: tetratricopeptide repeat protein [Gemmataceae bacterium]|nr:tetratricopeptide repeat protein [Gemmataceae bacterium]